MNCKPAQKEGPDRPTRVPLARALIAPENDVRCVTGIPASFPDDGRVFEGSVEARFLALALEAVVQDMSPGGDQETAKQLGDYMLGEGPPPDDTPEYVELEDGHITLSDPPFVLAEMDLETGEEYTLEVALDSDRNLLIDPPVEVTFAGEFGEVVDAAEQMFAEIYRTRGRRMEMLDAGTAESADFTGRR